jgi:SAM-dependent methyltransferase
MVHALDEIRRTLKPDGVLIDLRPLEARWPVEVATATGFIEVGRLTDLPGAIADDEAASQAMLEAQSRSWFVKLQEKEFPFFYYWDTPSEMKEFMEIEWEGLEKLEDRAFEAVKSAWAVASADARVRIRVKMLITKWRGGNKVGLIY